MNDTKEKSAVRAGTLATEKNMNISSNNIIFGTDEKIKMISIEKLKHHPDNPRKDIGDITELTDSIRKNGIMQNLTVIPKEDCYWVLIGNRRFEASAAAGLTELPCKVVDGLTPAQQLGIMLEENMQRNDLTIIEQAQGFQLMLDFGETVESIAKRTGFSKKTVNHRLKIAELDPDILKKKSKEFQLSMTDMIALEKISDPVKRDEILNSSTSSDHLRQKIDIAILQEKRDQMELTIIQRLKDKGIQQSQKIKNIYDSNIKRVAEYSTYDPECLSDIMDEIDGLRITPELEWVQAYRSIVVVRKKTKEETKEETKPKTAEEIEKEKKEKKREKLHRMIRNICLEMKNFTEQRMIECGHHLGDFRCSDRELRWIWDTLTAINGGTTERMLCSVFLQKNWYESKEDEKRSARRKLRLVPVGLQMLYLLTKQLDLYQVFYDYSTLKYVEKNAEPYEETYHILKGFGFCFSEERAEEYEAVLDGSHKFFTKEEKENA